MVLPTIQSAFLGYPGIRHAFFTREGGVSEGVYATLNGGMGSRDDKAAVAENRRRMAEALGLASDRLLVPYQTHSAIATMVDRPWTPDERPRADGIVTATPGLAIGVTGADCGMVLFAEAEVGVVGACHAGWKGALDDVPGATVTAMEAAGAARGRIVAVLGPTIAAASYEVGPEFVARFLDADPAHAGFFTPSVQEEHRLFDLPGFIGMRCRAAGVGQFEDMGLDTYADAVRFYSNRRKTHNGEADFGRLVAAIALG